MDVLRRYGPQGQEAIRMARVEGRFAAPPPGVMPQTMVYGSVAPGVPMIPANGPTDPSEPPPPPRPGRVRPAPHTVCHFACGGRADCAPVP